MIKKLVFIVVAFILGIFVSTQEISAKPVSAVLARQIAIQKLREIANPAHFSLTEAVQITGSENCILGYVFRLNPIGYIVVSADTRLRPVIAHSTNSQFGEFDLEKNILLQILTTDLENRQKFYQKQSSQTKIKNRLRWQQYLQPELRKANLRTFRQWPPEGTTITGGWLQTQWDQTDPFNRYCPLDPAILEETQQEQRSLAGCPAVALAQIIYFYKTLNQTRFVDNDDYTDSFQTPAYRLDDDFERYDFLSFPQLNEKLDEIELRWENRRPLTALNKAALVFACGIAAKQVYSTRVSGTFSVKQAYDAYLRFNFTDAILYTTNTPDSVLYPALAQNMKAGRPAHLAVITPQRTAGHNLVVDGYNTNAEYHLNFGFQGTYDGWYALPDASIPGYAFTVIEGVIVDLYDPAKAAVGAVVKPKVANFHLINYPNPFNPQTTIEYHIPATAQVKLQVFDLLGRQVRELVNAHQPAGHYRLVFEASDLPSGIYFCRLSVGRQNEMHQMLLLR